MTNRIHTAVLSILLATLWSGVITGAAPRAESTGPAERGRRDRSRPCLVPPVPQKKGQPPPLGGAAGPPVEFAPAGRGLLFPRGGTAGVPRVHRVLYLRVDFEDEPMDSSAAYFERLVLFLGQYYEQTSGGQVRLEPTLTPTVYRLPQTMAYYGSDDSIGTRQAILCYDAVRAADLEFDYSAYDQVMLFHGGPGQESDVKDDSRGQIWSAFFRQDDFAYYLPRPGAENGLSTNDRTASGDTLYVTSLGMYPETETQDGYIFSCVGVVCHEMAHSLGLPDLYDTVAPEDQVFAESQGIGNWDLMASGTWNGNGFIPGEVSAWSKVFLGWIEPLVVSADREVSLRAVEHDRRGGVVKVPLNGNEYFLIENRLQDANGNGRFDFHVADSTRTCRWEKQGSDSTLVCHFDFYHDSYAGAEWDYFLPGEGAGSGLLIWHVDESILAERMETNTVNSDPLHKGVDLEEADGIQDLDSPAADIDGFGSPFDAFRAGWADRFGPDTVPDSDGYHGTPSFVTIDNISAADSVMTFRVGIGGRHDNWPVITAGPIGGNHVGVADLDGDPDREVAVADRSGNLYVLDPDGSAAWTGGGGQAFANLGTPVGPPLLADVDGDGRTDLVVMADDGRVFGFAGGSGRPLGRSADGWLVTSPNPMPGVQLWAFDLDPRLPGVEFGFGGALDGSGLSRLQLYSVTADGRVTERGVASLHGGTGALPSVIVDLSGAENDGHLDILSSVRGGTPEAPRGSLQVHHFDWAGDRYYGADSASAPLPDTLFYSAPVVGDLDRDGRLDAVVTGSNGRAPWEPGRASFIYAVALPDAAAGLAGMEILPGWPRRLDVSGEDALSLADVDGNGFPEVLVLGHRTEVVGGYEQITGEVLHVLNYHGESLVSLPERLDSEIRYLMKPQLAPLVVDLSADGRPEIVLPLRDGQVIAVGADGSRFGAWNYFGGGETGSSPAVDDLDGDGGIELVTAADYLTGGRIDAMTIGRAAGAPAWGMVRRSGSYDGTLPPGSVGPVDYGAPLADVFVMPNPVRSAARFHYRVGAGVGEVTVIIFDLLGREVQRLEGTVHAGTDNTVPWNLAGADGALVAPGVYLARVEARGGRHVTRQTIKLAVLR